MHLKRRKPPKLGVKERPQVRCPQHLQWLRGHECSVTTRRNDCVGDIEAAHTRGGTDGGTGVKPSDYHAIPLCRFHHDQQHRMGERAFEKLVNINMREIAERLAKMSPHRKKWEKEE